jgi:hypothetical protein
MSIFFQITHILYYMLLYLCVNIIKIYILLNMHIVNHIYLEVI